MEVGMLLQWLRKKMPREYPKTMPEGPPRSEASSKDSLGALTMTDEEEENIFSNLKKNWKKTTLAIRSRRRLREKE
jgi:hypothetical protein